MERIKEINATLEMLELTFKTVTENDAKRSDVIKVVDWLRNTALLLQTEKAALEKQAESKQSDAKVIDNQDVLLPSVGNGQEINA